MKTDCQSEKKGALTLTNDSPSLSCRNTTSFSASKDDKKEEEKEEESTAAAGAAAVLAGYSDRLELIVIGWYRLRRVLWVSVLHRTQQLYTIFGNT